LRILTTETQEVTVCFCGDGLFEPT